jgi:hypothetical protein
MLHPKVKLAIAAAACGHRRGVSFARSVDLS